MKHIRTLFFDLDRTLWDFEKSSYETLLDLFHHYHVHIGLTMEFDEFLPVYRRVNNELWRDFEEGGIDFRTLRRLRWENTRGEMRVPVGDWTWEMATRYSSECPQKPYLLEGAVETLTALQPHFEIHLLTNGWTETQSVKVKHSGLEPYFDQMITSDAAQAQKPSEKIFQFALQQTKAHRNSSVYIGDNFETDMLGGRNAGWDVIFFNPLGKKYEEDIPQIHHLRELPTMLGREV